MVANAILVTIAVMLAIGFTLMGELKFFVPFKVIIWRAYSTYILAYVGILFVNVFAAAFALNRKFFLKDTGKKLSHLDKQFVVTTLSSRPQRTIRNLIQMSRSRDYDSEDYLAPQPPRFRETSREEEVERLQRKRRG